MAVNEWMPGEDRPIPFSRMVFTGDGDTDVPSFKMMMVQGGTSIAVFDPDEWADKGHSKTHDLIAEQRVHFVAPADYTETSQIDIVVGFDKTLHAGIQSTCPLRKHAPHRSEQEYEHKNCGKKAAHTQ